MKTPRLAGRSLRAARQLLDKKPFAKLARQQGLREHGMDRILDRPWTDRQHIDEIHTPIVGAPPRSFGEADSSLPAPDGAGNGRTTSAELHAAYVAGTVKPSEVLQRVRDIYANATFGPATHSPCISHDWDTAFAEAAASDARYAKGKPASPVDGVPTVIKDHHSYAGLPNWAGTCWNSEPAAEDAFVVQKLRKSGALIYGKSHATEWGMQPTGYNPHWLMPHNTYDETFAAGGSSTGTGVAVSLGLSPFGAGSDGGGSIRIPATLNGVFGFKPTYTRIGRSGDFWRYSSVAHNGPLGVSTADLVESLAATGTEHDPDDRLSHFAPRVKGLADSWRSALGRGLKGARIGVYDKAFQDSDPAIAGLCMTALKELEADGAKLVSLDIPMADLASALGVMVIGVETMGMLSDVEANYAEQTGDDMRLILDVLGQISARDYFIAARTRAGLRRHFAESMAQVDLIAMPAVACTAPPFALSEDRTAIYDNEATGQLTRLAFLGNLTGAPAGSVPVGLVRGLPVGLQFMGDAWDEASVFAAMAHCERLQLTQIQRPPVVHKLLNL
jgi:aspartyl-tRNA(Asn)/glutamyl-tRNA(Gln) amidotransferase subunit A